MEIAAAINIILMIPEPKVLFKQIETAVVIVLIEEGFLPIKMIILILIVLILNLQKYFHGVQINVDN